jgi:peptidyl-prolyl cis-trans isomerase B (cyclophilin B)
MKRKILPVLIIITTLLSVSGCAGMFGMNANPIWEYDFSEMRLVQLESPQEGQPIAIIHTTYGEFTAVLYPEYAPKTVENFIARIEDGFYVDRPIFGLVEEMFFLTGAHDINGQQGISQDGRLIPNENSVNLWPFKGSLMAFSNRQGYGDSRFLVSGSAEFTDEELEEIRGITKRDGSRLIPEELLTAFIENESMAGFMGGYTIFGQIIDGMETLDKILSLKSDDDNRPLEAIFIEKIELSEYKSQ